MMINTLRQWVVLLGCGGLLVLLLACSGGAVPAADSGTALMSSENLWACPPLTDGTAAVTTTDVLSDTLDPPVPVPTPYYRSQSFFVGQDVYSGSVIITVHGVTADGAAPPAQGGGIVRLVDLELTARVSMTLDLNAQIALREVRQPDGTGVRGWWRSDAVTQAAHGAFPTHLDGGESWRGRVAIRTPDGDPTLLYVFRTPQDALVTDQATRGLVVIDVRGHDPFCAANGPRPDIGGGAGGGGGGAGGAPPVPPVAVPPGTNALVAFAVSKIGRPYVWGSKGANDTYDCSGLTYAAYRSVGIAIPAGTTGGPAPGQGYYGTQIDPSALRPGDLLFFHTASGNPPTHVGMYVGDLDGDGTGDMIHSPAPGYTVSFVPNVFGNRFWSSNFWSARRMPGFPY